MYGLDVYRDIFGDDCIPDPYFVIPEHDDWPCNLWGFHLGKGVAHYILHSFTDRVVSDIAAVCTKTGGVVNISDRKEVIDAVSVSTEEDGRQRRRAAVLIPLCNRNGEGSVLFTLRSHNVGTHKGEVSFPGGHCQAGESVEDTALRETFEEVGDELGPVKVLGICQTVPAVTGTLVTPVIGFVERDVGDLTHLRPNRHEVASVFTRTVARLTDPSYRRYEDIRRPSMTGIEGAVVNYKLPTFGDPENDGQKGERIWGLTAWILDSILTKVIKPSILRR